MKDDFNPQRGSGLIFRASVLLEFRLTRALPAPSHRLPCPWQGFLAAIQRPCRRCAALASVSSYEERWQATVNLLLEPINLADEDLQFAVKAGLLCFPSICDRDIQGTLFSSLKMICSVEIQLKKNNCAGTLRTHSAFAKGARPRQSTHDGAAWLDSTASQLKVISNVALTSTWKQKLLSILPQFSRKNEV